MRAAPLRGFVPALLLVTTTAVWGSTFFMVRDIVRTVPAIDFLAVRFTLAAVVMLAIWWRRVRALSRRQLAAGVLLGVVYGVAQIGQTMALAHASASVSGFITGLYLVMTPPLAAVLLRERIDGITWAAVALATVGLGLLALNGLSVGPGEALALLGALLYALHVIGLGRFSTGEDAVGLAVVQVGVIALVCVPAALPDGLTLPRGTGQWADTAYMVMLASIFALWAQTWAQARMSATRAVILMTLEPVFAAGFAVLVGGERLTPRMLLGGACILAAMYAVELLSGRPPAGAAPGTDLPAESLHHDGA